MNWKYMKRDCVKMKIVQKQIHYLSSSTGFKIAISKSYQFIFTYILFHFFVTFKLRIVEEIFLPLIAYVIKGGNFASSVGLWKRRQVVKMWWLLNNGPSKFDILRLALEIQVDAQWVETISWEWFYLTRMLHQNGFHPIFWCFFPFSFFS